MKLLIFSPIIGLLAFMTGCGFKSQTSSQAQPLAPLSQSAQPNRTAGPQSTQIPPTPPQYQAKPRKTQSQTQASVPPSKPAAQPQPQPAAQPQPQPAAQPQPQPAAQPQPQPAAQPQPQPAAQAKPAPAAAEPEAGACPVPPVDPDLDGPQQRQQLRESAVGPACYISGPQDYLGRENFHDIDFNFGYADPAEFIKAVENRCADLNALPPPQPGISPDKLRKYYLNTILADPLQKDLVRTYAYDWSIKNTIYQAPFVNLDENFASPFLFSAIGLSMNSTPAIGIEYNSDNQNALKLFIKYLNLNDGFNTFIPISKISLPLGAEAVGAGVRRNFLNDVSAGISDLFENQDGGRQTFKKAFNQFERCDAPNEQECWKNVGAALAKIAFIEQEALSHLNLPFSLLGTLVGDKFENVVDYLALLKLDDPTQFSTMMRMLHVDKDDPAVLSDSDIENLGYTWDYAGSANDDEVTTIADFVKFFEAFLKFKVMQPQIAWIKDGFTPVVPYLEAANLNPRTLNLILKGNTADVKSLKEVLTATPAVFPGPTHEELTLFKQWLVEIVEEEVNTSPAFLAKLLTFWTGSAALPQNLNLQINTEENTQSLPKAATCFFTLKIPAYPSKEVFKQKLLLVVEEAEQWGQT
jgi:hypothetical protein